MLRDLLSAGFVVDPGWAASEGEDLAKDPLVAGELAAIEELRALYGGEAQRCEAVLAGRRRQWRDLYQACRIDQAQLAHLDRRLTAILRDLRLHTVAEGLSFLPPRLETELQAIMRDGYVSADEHERFIPMVEAEPLLAVEQRAQVEIVFERWYGQDHFG
jgi:hypothetical protein